MGPSKNWKMSKNPCKVVLVLLLCSNLKRANSWVKLEGSLTLLFFTAPPASTVACCHHKRKLMRKNHADVTTSITATLQKDKKYTSTNSCVPCMHSGRLYKTKATKILTLFSPLSRSSCFILYYTKTAMLFPVRTQGPKGVKEKKERKSRTLSSFLVSWHHLSKNLFICTRNKAKRFAK